MSKLVLGLVFLLAAFLTMTVAAASKGQGPRPALSSEQMGMTVDVGLRWQIDPQQAPRIFTEIGDEAQIHSAVRSAIRKGVRDGIPMLDINALRASLRQR